MESNQVDILAGKGDIEKLTLRVTSEAAGRLRELAARMGIPQGFAFERVISERDKARRVARKYRRKLRALERAGFSTSSANFERLGAQSESGSALIPPLNTNATLSTLGNITGGLKRAAGDHEKAQAALLLSLKETTTAAIKAAQSFSTIAVDAREAIIHIAQVKGVSQTVFELQDRQLKSKLDDIGKDLNKRIEVERKGYDELTLRKEKYADELLKHAEKLSAAYSQSFTEGVGQLAPEVEKIRVKIGSEVDKVARFNQLSIGIAGAVFLVGLALFYFYKPVVDRWDEHQQVSAAVTAVTSEYSKKIAAAETKATELQATVDHMKAGEAKIKKQAKLEAEAEVRKDVEKMRLRSFDVAVQKVQKELTDANRHIGELQSRNLDLRRKLIKNCSWFCFGDYSPGNGEMQ
jgi:hypothetical protein